MSSKFFFLSLTLTAFITVGILFTSSFFIPSLTNYANLGWISLILFMNITFLMFILGQKTINSPNKMLFSNVSMGFVLFKMLFSLMIVIAYKKITHPTSNLFIVPFFIVYITFTILETYLMIKITRK
jgi:hypothetical protein